MWDVFTTVANAVGMDIEYILLIVVFFGSMIFFAKGFQVGVSMEMLLTGGLFMWFYADGLQYGAALTVFLTWFVIMAISLYFMAKTQPSGGLI